MTGVCSAITAARAGVKVILVQDRPVLGGNASSEVRLWVLGATSHMGNNNRWSREGGVLDEILVENTFRNKEGNPVLFDMVLMDKVLAEPNITLLLNTVVYKVEKDDDRTIGRLTAINPQNGTEYTLEGRLFADCTGDGTLGYLAGASFRMGAEEMRCPVEVEFAVNMDVTPGQQQIFNLLQIRPIIDNQDNRAIDWEAEETSRALIYGEQALGIGMMADIADIIYVKSEAFDSLATEKIADELLTFNNRMRDEGRSYILVGPGRWGSSDPFLGVPVKWNHISEAKVIVECGIEKFDVEPSQGTHFFQNVTSLGVGYLTINPFRGDGIFREEELDARQALFEGTYLRQVRFEKPLWVCADGRSNKGMVREEMKNEELKIKN